MTGSPSLQRKTNTRAWKRAWEHVYVCNLGNGTRSPPFASWALEIVLTVSIGWLVSFSVITWATPVTSKGTPSEVSIFSQRQRMVIISRESLCGGDGGGGERERGWGGREGGEAGQHNIISVLTYVKGEDWGQGSRLGRMGAGVDCSWI